MLAHLLLAIAAVSSFILGARILRAGYGADNDTFLMLRTWDVLRGQGIYVPSRFQGSPIAELTIGAASQIGGHWMSGAVSVVLAAVSLLCVYDLVRRRISLRTDAAVVVAILAATPIFAVAATTSADYLYGLCWFLIGLVLIERGHSSFAIGVVLGLAAAGRISYAPLGVALILLHPSVGTAARRFMATGSMAIATLIAYLPAVLGAEQATAIFTADRPTGQGLVGLFGRAVLKSGSVFGAVGTVIAVLVVASAIRTQRLNGTSRWEGALLGIILLSWIWLPVEPSYLLPGVVVGLLWLCRPCLIPAVRPLLLALLAATTLYGWVDIQLLSVTYKSRYGFDSCLTTEATGASFSPRVVRGPLLEYPDLVFRNAFCNDAVRNPDHEP